ncbi:hypothetical protein SAMN05444920_1428 [Nonomuraea solani]|uniref:Carboxymuconolactone decarboxylase family protein n=1 Tax=Nonomuraea solani TaxID=1144553 RepID=A0A1H6F0M6_9ACTN|nr:hypothetical protein SAMN05444920_1428 [Nonomuraea solani]
MAAGLDAAGGKVRIGRGDRVDEDGSGFRSPMRRARFTATSTRIRRTVRQETACSPRSPPGAAPSTWRRACRPASRRTVRRATPARRTGSADHERPFTGALIGPFPVMLRFPGLSRPLLEWFTTVTNASVLPARVREVAILTTGSRYGAAYELYSHSRIAVETGAVGRRRRGAGRRATAPGADAGGVGRARCGGLPLCRCTASVERSIAPRSAPSKPGRFKVQLLSDLEKFFFLDSLGMTNMRMNVSFSVLGALLGVDGRSDVLYLRNHAAQEIV